MKKYNPTKHVIDAQHKYLEERIPEMKSRPLLSSHAPVCNCGHDVFYHQIVILRHNSEGDATQITIGGCNETDGTSYTCKCRRFNSIDSWMNELWEKIR